MKNKIFISLFLLLFPCIVWAQNQVGGIIKDANGDAVIGANIIEKGSNGNGTVSDLNGMFRLKVPGNAHLIISYIGYERKDVAVNNRKNIVVILKENVKMLNEVVAIGYGTAKKRDLTGSVASANIKEIEKVGASNISDVLGGRIAGLNLSSIDGAPGAETEITLRGAGFSQDASPLFIIDGFPMENFSLNSLDPSNIESIDVLKDASSIAIYGSRGANGVIIINTKKPKAGKVSISYSGNVSCSVRPNFVKMMSPYDYVKMELELESLRDYQRDYVKDRYLGKADEYGVRPYTLDYYKDDPGTDWQKVITRNAISQNHSLRLNGGSNGTVYKIQLGYTNQNGMVMNTGMKRYSANVTLMQTISSKLKLTLQANSTQTITSSNTAYSQARQFAPTSGFMDTDEYIAEMESLLENGEITDSEVDFGNLITPLQQAQNEYDKRYQSWTSLNGELEWKLSKYLTFQTSFGATFTNTRRDKFYNSKTRQGMIFKRSSGVLVNTKGINASRSIDDVKSYLTENIFQYNRSLSRDSKLGAMFGFTYQWSAWNPVSYAVSNIVQAFENLKFDRLDTGTPYGQIESQRSENQLASLLGRVNYTYKDRYLFTASLRDDGSSKFAKGHQWGLFPSAAFAWRFSEEGFMDSMKSFLTYGKLRLSYGSVGNNRNVMDYAYAVEFNPGDQLYSYRSGYNGNDLALGAMAFFYANKQLTWEKTRQFNLGLDLSFLDDRINITADAYISNLSDMLIPHVVSYTLGYGNGANTRVENVGKVRNKGLEFTVNTTNIKNRSFMWTSCLTLGLMSSKVVSFANGSDKMVNYYSGFSPTETWIAQVGKSVSQFYGYKFAGLYQESDFTRDGSGQYTLKPGVVGYKLIHAAYRLQPGDAKYEDLNGDGYIDENDRTTLGSPIPVLTGGLSNTFDYKNFSLSIFFHYNFGNKLINFNKAVYENGSYSLYSNQLADYVNRWTPDNTDTDISRMLKPVTKGDVNNSGAAKLSTRYIEDGSFVRLKSVSLSYRLTKKMCNHIGLQGVLFTFSAQNLFVITKYSGQDPEVNSYMGGYHGNVRGAGYSTISNSSEYTSLTGGLDHSAYPRPIVLSIGANITF
jgi:TonB-linked SusC/RagA family outer membrane protein